MELTRFRGDPGLGVAEDRRLAEDRLCAQPAHGDSGMMFISTALAVVLGLGILVKPLTAAAQPVGRGWRIGLFHVALDHVPPSLDRLREGLAALGYEEGKNIHLDWRNLVDEEAARATAQAFVRERVDLIVAFENQTVRAVTAATTKIPVVMLHVTAPVEDGFIKSFAGGNVTGFAG